MEKISIPKNNPLENSSGIKDTLTEEIKSLEKEIDLIKSENQELFNEYQRIKDEEVSFVMELAYDKCIENDEKLISQNQKLLIDYLVNGTVTNNTHLKEEHNNSKMIAIINTQV